MVRNNGSVEFGSYEGAVEKWKIRLEQYAATVSIQADPETGEAVDDHRDDVALRMDVASVLADMTPIQREVCIRRARGDSMRKIARDLGLRRRPMARIAAAIRRRFQDAGLGEQAHE